MTVSDTIQGTAEIRAERDRLAAEGKQILERSAGTLSDEDAQRFGEIEADLEDLRKRHDQWAMVERALANGWTESGDGARRDNLETAQHLRRTDPWADLDRPLESEPGQIRSRALTAVERLERMPDKAREAATRAIEDDDDHTSRLARYTLLASDPQHYKAFSQWFNDPLSGPHSWTPAERDAARRVKSFERAMSLGTGSAGGFLVPYELDPNILISSAGSVDPIRTVARVTQTAYNEKRFVTSAGVVSSWDAEAAEVSDDSPTLTQPTVVCHKGAAYVQVSYELDEDSDIAQQLGELFADSKAQLEATAFTLGTGSGQPWGVVQRIVASHAGSIIATGTNALAAADVFTNQNSLPARWRPRARFMANLSIINGYRVLPKGAGLADSLVDDSGPRPRMAGWEVVENSNMDGALNASAADYVLLSGDFRQYAIVDRIGTSIIPVPVVVGTNRRPTGERGWYLHWRTGGDVLIGDAFRLTNYSG